MLRLLALIFALPGWLYAADFHVPALTGPVVDEAHMLTSEARDQVSDYLRRLKQNGGAQIQVATVPSLEGLPIEEASIQIVDQWKIGRAKEDRGVLLLIAPNEHQLRIEVGRGLEGDLPDVIASRIIRGVITPRLRAGDPSGAVIDGVMAIAHYTDPQLESANGDASAAQPEHRYRRGSPLGAILKLIFWLILIVIFLRPRRRGFFWSGGGWGGGGFDGGGFGGWGGGSSGGGWSGGGGGFSGGGASGSW